MTMRAAMLSVDDVRAKARRKFERNWPVWVAQAAIGVAPGASFSVGLNPPTERQALDDLAGARVWVREWSECPFPGEIEWVERHWPSVGAQRLPVAVRMSTMREVAAWAGETELLSCAESRAEESVRMLDGVLASEGWTSVREAESGTRDGDGSNGDDGVCNAGVVGVCDIGAVVGTCGISAVADALKRSLPYWCELCEADWRRALAVMEWLVAHPRERRYARQLPIRGVDTKWVEKHGRCVRPLASAAIGEDPSFMRPSKQFRCRALDGRLAIGGIREMALSAEELGCYPKRPSAVVVCENLVSMLCLEDEPGVLAVHGGGFAVAELADVPWLSDVPILYWGDLDSNGFAILNTFRSSFPHVRSVLMDEETLTRHLDLCVIEDKPFVGELAHLNGQERKVLNYMLEGDGLGALRLEQERIEWEWACDELKRAYRLAKCVSA